MLLPSRSFRIATGQSLQRSIGGQSEAFAVDLGLNGVASGSNVADRGIGIRERRFLTQRGTGEKSSCGHPIATEEEEV